MSDLIFRASLRTRDTQVIGYVRGYSLIYDFHDRLFYPMGLYRSLNKISVERKLNCEYILRSVRIEDNRVLLEVKLNRNCRSMLVDEKFIQIRINDVVYGVMFSCSELAKEFADLLERTLYNIRSSYVTRQDEYLRQALYYYQIVSGRAPFAHPLL